MNKIHFTKFTIITIGLLISNSIVWADGETSSAAAKTTQSTVE